jgi:hypothetical protein
VLPGKKKHCHCTEKTEVIKHICKQKGILHEKKMVENKCIERKSYHQNPPAGQKDNCPTFCSSCQKLKVDCLTIVSSQNKHCMCMQQKLIQILNEITKNTHNNQAS